MVSNQGKITTLAADASVNKGLVDGTDKLHSGIIKVLESFAQGDMCIGHAGFTITDGGTYTQYNLAQPIEFFAKGQYVNYTSGNLTVAYSSTVQDASNSRYDWVLLNPNIGGTPSIVIVQGTAGTTPLVSDITAGYIPIALVHISAGTDNDKFDYSFQTFTLDKAKNSLSIMHGGSEVGSLVGDSNGITLAGLYKLDTLPTASVAATDKVIIQDTDDSDIIKTVTASAIAGLATGISNVVEDSSPQLGGNLDANGNNILIDNGNFIGDENGLEQIKFATTASAVNEITVTNAATGNGPTIESTGGDTNIDLNIKSKGTTSQVKVNDNMALDNGYIQIGTQDSSLVVGGSGTSAGYDLLISAGSTSKGSNNLDGGDLILKSGGGDGTGTSIMTFFTKVDGTDDTAERMRIDTLGNLLVGGTGVSSTKLGVNGAVGAQAYHGAITEFTGNGLAGQNVLNLDASTMRTIITRSPSSAPNPPNEVGIVCPVSTTIEGWECRILCQENAGGPDNTFIVTQGSDEVHDVTGATIANSSGTTFSLVAGKAYQLICITNNRFILYQIN